MANAIQLITKYIAMLDEIYQREATTSSLDGDISLVRAGANTNEIMIPRISMSGLAEYSRNSGYVQGSVNLEWQTVRFNFDRGRRFTVDAMDNEETAGMAFGMLSSEFIRTKVVPELDAFRYATYAGLTGISTATANISTGLQTLEALRIATNQMDEDQVPIEDRRLRITPTLLTNAQNVDTTTSKDILGRFGEIVQVPQVRFYSAINQLDGKTSGEEEGGFEKAAGAKNINFMVIHKPALLQYTKHQVSKAFRPEENQFDDGWVFPFRSYGLADAYQNKLAGIYAHFATV